VALEENRDDAALAVAQAENILQKYPKLDAFYATSAPGAPAAVAALRSRGRAGQVKVVGFDLDRENLKAIEKGWLTAIIEQRPFSMGELSVKWLMKLSRGERPSSRTLDTGVEVVTRENAKQAASLL
jgi:ribose transport system substrate-binding protein